MVSEISASEGFVSGGQELEIHGHGLSGEAVSVKIDGVECRIREKRNDKITCVSGEKGSISTIGVD